MYGSRSHGIDAASNRKVLLSAQLGLSREAGQLLKSRCWSPWTDAATCILDTVASTEAFLPPACALFLVVSCIFFVRLRDFVKTSAALKKSEHEVTLPQKTGTCLKLLVFILAYMQVPAVVSPHPHSDIPTCKAREELPQTEKNHLWRLDGHSMHQWTTWCSNEEYRCSQCNYFSCWLLARDTEDFLQQSIDLWQENKESDFFFCICFI